MNILSYRNIAKEVIKRSQIKLPDRATVHAIDGDVCDIRVRRSGGIIRDVPIVGSGTISVGETVTLIWSAEPGSSGPRPSVLKGTALILSSQE